MRSFALNHKKVMSVYVLNPYVVNTKPTDYTAYYKLYSDANDLSSNALNGVNNGNISFLTPVAGVANLSSNKYISIADNALFTFANSSSDLPFTIQFRFLGSPFNTYSFFVAKRATNSNGQREWQVYHYPLSNIIGVVLFDNSTGGQIGVTVPFVYDNTKEYKVDVTYDGSGAYTGISVYINNVKLVTSSSNSGTYTRMRDTTAAVNIGRAGYDSVTGYLTGYMKEVKIFRRKLAEWEL